MVMDSPAEIVKEILSNLTDHRRCSAPRVAHGTFNTQCDGTLALSWCRMQCHEGYDPRWPIITCNAAGHWTVVPECVPRNCGTVPKIPNAADILTASCSNIKHGATCPLKCEAGYHPT